MSHIHSFFLILLGFFLCSVAVQSSDSRKNVLSFVESQVRNTHSSNIQIQVQEQVEKHVKTQIQTHILDNIQSRVSNIISNGDKPGLRFMLENSGVNKIIQDALPEIVENIKSTPFPDQSITTTVALAGEITVNLTHIRISSLEINSVSASFVQPNILTTNANGVSIVIDLDFSFKQKSWPHTAGTGDVQSTCTGANIALSVAIFTRADDAEKPLFNATSALVSLGTMNIKIHGGGSVGWLLSLLENLFKTQIKKSLETNIQDSLITTINVQLNDAIHQAPFVIPIPFPPETGMTGEIDVGLANPATVSDPTSPVLVIDSKMKFGIPGKPASSPFTPVDLPTKVSSTSNDFSLYVTQWIPNNAIWQLFNDGKLKYRITDDIIPPESPIHLNTNDLKNYIPELFEKFPNQSVVVDVEALYAPYVQFDIPVYTVLNVSLTFSVVDATKAIVPAFKMNTNAYGSMSKVNVQASEDGSALKITGKLDEMKISTELVQSWMGPVNVDRIRVTVSILINNGILPTINEKLEAGILIELPKGLIVSNIVFQFLTGYLSLGGQVKYTPSCGTTLHWIKRLTFMSQAEKMVLNKYGCISGFYDRPLCRELICNGKL